MKKFNGIVVSMKMTKTAVVEVLRSSSHPLYKKIILRSKRYKVDTGEFTPSVDDRVEIVETKPVSKDKYFVISQITSEKKQDIAKEEKSKPVVIEKKQKKAKKVVKKERKK